MKQRMRFTPSGMALAIAAGAMLGLGSAPGRAAPLDISQAPLASSSDISVLPNVLFLLDDSGSMEYDTLPDHTERTAQAGERRYLHTVGTCKPKGILTTSSTGSLNGLPSTHCDRVDPPFGAVQHNGQYYNPEYTYRPPLQYDGTSFPPAPNPAKCDPFGTSAGCEDFYSLNSNYYADGQTSVNDGSGTQNYSNSNVKEWYGTSSDFDVNGSWPEIVYCSSTSGDVNNLDQCRRNGLATSTDARHTGNPFRYSTARWGRGTAHTGNTLPAGLPSGGAYPEAAAIHEFTRPLSGSTATVTVNMAFPHGLSANGTFQIVPRTGTDMDPATAGTPVTVTATTANRYVVTYSDTGTTKLAYGAFDLVVSLSRANVSSTGVITVNNAWNHGLAVGDRISVTELSCSTCGGSSFTATNSSTVAVQVTQINNAHSFAYTVQGGATQARTGTGYYRKAVLFNIPKLRRGTPHYYTLLPVEHCSDAALTTCTLSATPTGAFTYPAPLRYCLSQFDAYRLDGVTGNNHSATPKPRCRKKYEEATGYSFPRYGQFRRVDVTSATGSYTDGDRTKRKDCAGFASNSCSFAEEQQNFRNWFSYYRVRMLAMKTAAGIAFAPIDNRYRVGFLTINPDSPVDSNKYLLIDKFESAHKKLWYEKFYDKSSPSGGTPLPEALSRAGRHFAGKTDGINKGMSDDPMQYSCQQNFVILTTDGYWGGRNGKNLTSGSIPNQDAASGTNPPFYDGGSGAYDPDGTKTEYSNAGTLADVALYYYQTDLRPTGSVGALGEDVSENNVPTREDTLSTTSGAKTPNWQHMITFGLGMAEGLMDWREDYESRDATGDFDKVRAGASSGCAWTTGKCNWPVPGERAPSNLDDLWHASVNGRGKFFYARDTKMVQDGLTNTLLSLQERNAAGAAAATSTPNITPADRGIYKTSYTTVDWYGEVTAQLINPSDGSVVPDILWSAKDKLQAQVGVTTDARKILIGDYSKTGGHKDFLYSELDAATERPWFDGKCSFMTQCITLDATQQATADSGTNMVNYLRGRSEYEALVYRDRAYALGDTVNAVPLYIAKPRLGFVDATAIPYSTFVKANATRTPMLYVGANDGMLHAINANTGSETWAFIPRQVAPEMWRLADEGYASKHRYYVDGSPTFMDIWDGSSWRTILVGGLNAGGRGFYALDVTVPSDPKALWEICHDKNLCPIFDEDMGHSFGNPIITKRADGTWVVIVTSGYNNVAPGDGRGYLFILDALKGTVLDKVQTPDGGSTTSPSGLGKISGWADNFYIDNTAKWIYGGDQEGSIWKFDLTGKTVTVTRLGQALAADGKPQPITTRPELGLIDEKYKVVFVGTGRYLGLKDLSDPATQDPKGEWSWQQSLYAFKDDDTKYGSLRDAGLVEQKIIGLAGGEERSITANKVDWSTSPGWFVDFNPGNASPGERVTVDPQLALGTLLVATNVPGATACAVGGDSWIYQFDYKSGSFVYGAPGDIVARKQTGALTVGMVVYQLQKGSIVGQVQRSETSMRKEDLNIAPGATPSRRTSWREITPDQ
jgi:type IV pilus assembly protein PilY1